MVNIHMHAKVPARKNRAEVLEKIKDAVKDCFESLSEHG
jgi:hypothetical protein